MIGAVPGVRRGRGRVRALAAVAAFALLGATGGVEQPVAVRPAGAVPAQSATPGAVRYVDDVFAEVERTEDVPYREAPDVDGEPRTLFLDIYEPAGDTAELRPVVVLFHGGFLVFGDHKSDSWGAGPQFAESFARKGYVAVSVQYRLRPGMGLFPDVDLAELEAAGLDAHDDAVAAIQWLDDNAADLRLDPRAVVAYGPSAGGAIAWNLAWMQGSRLRPEPTGIAAAVSVAGAPFETTAEGSEPLAAASPGEPPVIAFHGTADPVLAFELAEGPCTGAAALGVRCDLVPYEGIGHPGIDPRFLELIADTERRTAEFLAETVLAPLGYVEWPLPTDPPVTEPPVTEPPDAEPPPATAPDPAASDPQPAMPAAAVAARPAYTG